MIVAIAAAIAVLIAIIVAAALTGSASASPIAEHAGAVAQARSASSDKNFHTVMLLPSVPTRDVVYQVVSPPIGHDRSLVIALVAGMFLATTAAAGIAWRALGRSIMGPGRSERQGTDRARR